MNYELAKQLKDAGFPQVKKLGGAVFYQGGKESHVVCTGEGYECDCTTVDIDGYGMSAAEETVYAPTLSELIEACGEGFKNLNKFEENEWVTNFMEDENPGGDSRGSTPEESVAKLWLALNKK